MGRRCSRRCPNRVTSAAHAFRQAFPLCPRKLTWTGLGGFSSYRPIGKMVCEATSPQAIVNMFHRWYRPLGFVGCSSHSGRRTFITNAARKISTVGGSLRDVQELAGHSNLRTTQRYIDENPEAHARVVELV